MTKNNPDNLTEAEAAAHLRTSIRTLRSLRQKAVGPAFVRVGRRIIYRLVDLKQWQWAQRQGVSE
jgi:hypothetical protein